MQSTVLVFLAVHKPVSTRKAQGVGYPLSRQNTIFLYMDYDLRSYRTTFRLIRGCVAFLLSNCMILWQPWLTFLWTIFVLVFIYVLLLLEPQQIQEKFNLFFWWFWWVHLYITVRLFLMHNAIIHSICTLRIDRYCKYKETLIYKHLT